MKILYKSIFALALTATALTSCDFTDLTPTDQIDDSSIYSSVTSLEQTVTGAYALMSYKQLVRVSAVLSDDVIKGGQNGGAGDDTYQWTYTAPTGEHNDIWSRQYRIINLTNRILQGAEGVQANDADETARKNNCIGTAKFLRAYSALELLLYFSDIENESGYGIPYVTEPVILQTPGRNTVKECFDNIVQDLNDARSLLTLSKPSTPGYANQLAVDALLARIYLYRKDYAKADEYAKKVLDQMPLADINEYADIWSDKSEKEVVWKLKRNTGDETIGTIFWSGDNSSAFEPAPAFIACFEAGDVRLSTFVGDGVDRDNVPVKRVNKYKGSDSNVGLADAKMIRSSEMLLIRAEVAAQSDLTAANKLLNQLRANRIEGWVDQTYSTKTEFIDELLLERRRELCFEGHRFFDMRRYKRALYKPLIDKTLEVGNYRWLMPIPNGEMQGNSVIASQQNPGY